MMNSFDYLFNTILNLVSKMMNHNLEFRSKITPPKFAFSKYFIRATEKKIKGLINTIAAIIFPTERDFIPKVYLKIIIMKLFKAVVYNPRCLQLNLVWSIKT